MTFTEEWFSDASCVTLAQLVKQVAGVDGMIVEIGSWEGRSTVAMANAAYPRRVHACDTWEGSPGEPSADLATQRDVFTTWQHNIRTLTRRNVTAHRMGWREFLPTITEPVALAFIDAEHSYVEVRDNLLALLPLMAEGGIICGDDSHHGPVRDALVEVLDPQQVALAGAMWYWIKPLSNPTLRERYEHHARLPSDIWLHLPRMVKLVEAFNAQRVVELGARSGLSTSAWLVGLEKTGGHLTSIDIDEAPPIGDHKQWTFIQGDDTDPDIVASVEDGSVDVLFIDTSHHYGHTLWELRNWSAKVRPGGVIVCHDTELERPTDPPAPATDPPFPVKQAIIEFAEERQLNWVNIPDCWGLAIIEVT